MANLLAIIPPSLPDELIEVVVRAGGVRIERIVSMAHRTPPGEWYDQDTDEFVLLLRGSAALRFADDSSETRLAPGDWLAIPAHRRHRVEWTDPNEPTIWLAVHYPAAPPPPAPEPPT
jgi:cupin 2 domain-containing protein